MIEISVKNDCIKCGRCVSVCPAYIFEQEEKLSDIELQNIPSCIDCGQCVAICPTDSVVHSSFPASKVHDIRKDIVPSPDALMELLKARRSNRAISDRDIDKDKLEMVLKAASYAPTGGNRQPLEYTLVTDRKLIQDLIDTTIKIVKGLIAKTDSSDDKELRANLPYYKGILAKHEAGQDVIMRNATSMILIHSHSHSKSPMAGADANLAYQNASLMAESIGLAHFYTGYICIFSSMDAEGLIKDKLGIKGTILAGMGLGMPQYRFNKYVDRKEQKVRRFN